jgi:hypothetical protein
MSRSFRSSAFGTSKEERIAERIALSLSDLRLDLDAIAFAISRQPYTTYRRFIEVAEGALDYEEQDLRNEWK